MTEGYTSAPDARAEALAASYERAGYARVAPALLQPAEPFLDLSGEDIRRRMYLTADPDGQRTLPAARPHHPGLARLSRLARRPARRSGYCYLGPVFRHRDDGPDEFLQAGIESLRPHRHRGGRCRDARARAGSRRRITASTAPEIRMGDVGLFAALVAALDLAPAWKRRLIKDFNRKESLAQDLERLSLATANGRPEYQGVLAALAGSDPKGAHALVTDLLSIAGITAVGGRSVGEIADRFLEQAALGAATALPRETRDGDREISRHQRRSRRGGRRSCARWRAEADRDSIAALDLFESRTGFLAARGVDVQRIRFSTAFGRGLDYYTGFVFELHDPTSASSANPLVAGGRYDGLLTRLGAPAPIPAVGFAVWIERLAAIGRRGMSAPSRHRGAVERPAAGKRRSLFRARGPAISSSRAARANIAAPSPASTASRSPISRRPKSPRSSRKARRISASPARIWCAR